ncbi:MAG: SUF system Fe-S cluster assembly regulator [Alphaproteobacteria bacterium]
MIRLSRMADYSVIAMSRLAQRPDRQFTAAELAHETALPQATVSKILKLLSHAGLLTSQRGPRGGYSLAEDAADIPVAHIIAAVDGPIALTECSSDGETSCNLESLCPTSTAWKKINTAINQALDNLTLADLSAPDLIFPDPTRPVPAPTVIKQDERV